jgi:hypothetical protein
MRKWLIHPWTLTVGGALLTGILSELSPLHLFSAYVTPWLSTLTSALLTNVQTPRWVLYVEPLAGAALVVLGKYVVNILRQRKKAKVFQGIFWEKSPEGEQSFRPICKKCRLPLHPRIEAEEHKDRNNVPFTIIPEYPNTLVCLQCDYRVNLKQPWEELLATATVYLSATLSHKSSRPFERDRSANSKQLL